MNNAPVLKLKIPTVGVQGSLKAMGVSRTGSVMLKYPSGTVAARNLFIDRIVKKWGGKDALTGPIMVDVTFEVARPQSHYGTGRNEGKLKPSSPEHLITRPDYVDKGLRLLLDALDIAGVIVDDSQVVQAHSRKRYAAKRKSRTLVSVYTLGVSQ